MPVPLLMIMAPNRGDQPCVSNGFTCGFFNVTKVQPIPAAKSRTAIMMRMTGTLMKSMYMAETNPRRHSVMRSPRHAAIGGAMLSVELFKSYIRFGEVVMYLDLARICDILRQGHT